MGCDPEICQKREYYGLALDPIHIGTGGYRIGMVDNTIMREPGTDLPKIPGSSLCGVARAYTAMHFPEKYQRERKGKDGKVLKDKEGKTIYDSCAGKGGEDGEGHCGERDCPVCIPYGFTKKEKGLQGMAQFSDARILLFPVYSIIGPVWVTSPGVLRDFGQIEKLESKEKIRMAEPGLAVEEQGKRYLNLGWFMLELENNEKVKIDLASLPNIDGADKSKLEEIQKRLILVSDDLLPQIVNDNLEVRTSVSIDPQTGAAESRALFTYEAIPRTTVLWFSVTYNNPRLYSIDNKPLDKDIAWVRENVRKGLNYFQHFGVGGMGTRGMGRIEILNIGGNDEEAS
jgi:CRISPR-associated protein Cmr4